MEKNKSSIEIYRSENGDIELKVKMVNDSVWLSQNQMAVLFNRDRTVIARHIKNCYTEGELDPNITCAKFAHMGTEGDQVYEKNMYNLDVIISVGYRVKSHQGTQFRIWATQRLRDYIIKGVALNDERFKRGNSMNYFKDLLERIREIRLSERVFYQQIKDIYATSIDYNPNDELTLQFFKEVQNKLLWAVSGKTAVNSFIIVQMRNYQ